MTDALWLAGKGEMPADRWAERVGLASGGPHDVGPAADFASVLEGLRERGLEVAGE